MWLDLPEGSLQQFCHQVRRVGQSPLPVMLAVPKHLFSRARCSLPPPAESGAESVAFKNVFEELVDDYHRYNTAFRSTRFVCNSSSNNLTLDLIYQLATWLQDSSLTIYALDLSFNRIFSASWEPVLKVIGQLGTHVEYLRMGGNNLPALTETDELSKLQEAGCVSLASPMTGSPVIQWQKKWDDIATDFMSKAYDPDVPYHG